MEGTSKVFNNNNNSIAKKKRLASSSDVSGSSAASAMSTSKPPLLSSARISSRQARKKPYAGMHFYPTDESSTDTSVENDPLIPQPECNYNYEIPIGSSAAINGVQFKLGHNIASDMAITKLRRWISYWFFFFFWKL